MIKVNYATREACWVTAALIKLDLLCLPIFHLAAVYIRHLSFTCREPSLQLQLPVHPLPPVLSPSSHSPDPFSLDACLFYLKSL